MQPLWPLLFKCVWIQSVLPVLCVELSIHSKVKRWSKGEVRRVCNTRACECYTKNSCLTAEWAIFCWLCGFIDRGTEWQGELGTSDTLCEKCNSLLLDMNSSYAAFCLFRPSPLLERIQNTERESERLGLIDWYKGVKIPGITAG